MTRDNEPATKDQGPSVALQLLPYQRRWVEDNSALKLAVKARQIGYSFAATLRAVLKCLERKTTWIFLSKGERQSRLLMEKVHEHIQSCGIVAKAFESAFFEGTSHITHLAGLGMYTEVMLGVGGAVLFIVLLASVVSARRVLLLEPAVVFRG